MSECPFLDFITGSDRFKDLDFSAPVRKFFLSNKHGDQIGGRLVKFWVRSKRYTLKMRIDQPPLNKWGLYFLQPAKMSLVKSALQSL